MVGTVAVTIASGTESSLWALLRAPALLAVSGSILTLGGLAGLLRAYWKYSRRLKHVKRARHIKSVAEAEAVIGSASLLKTTFTGIFVKLEGHVVCRSPFAAPGSNVLAAMAVTQFHHKNSTQTQDVPWSCAIDGGAVRIDSSNAVSDLEPVAKGRELSEWVLRAGSCVFVTGLLFPDADGFVVRSGPLEALHVSFRRERDVESSLQKKKTAWNVGAGSVLLSGLLLCGMAYLRADTRVSTWYR